MYTLRTFEKLDPGHLLSQCLTCLSGDLDTKTFFECDITTKGPNVFQPVIEMSLVDSIMA